MSDAKKKRKTAEEEIKQDKFTMNGSRQKGLHPSIYDLENISGDEKSE
jgi:hypothetical protein